MVRASIPFARRRRCEDVISNVSAIRKGRILADPKPLAVLFKANEEYMGNHENVILAYLDLNGTIIAVNRAWHDFAKTNGLVAVNSGIGKNYLEACTSRQGEDQEDASSVASGLRKVLSEEIPIFIHEYSCHSRTERRWFQLIATPYLVEGERGALVAHVPITERKEASIRMQESEAHLRRSEENLKIAVASLSAGQKIAHLGNWDWDIETGEENWSDEQCRIFGYAPQSIRFSYEIFLDAVHPEDRDRVIDAVGDTLEGAAPYSEEFRIIRPDGDVRYVRAQGQVSRAPDGEPIAMAGTVLDITERRKIEENLQRAQRLEALGQLTGGIAHDFNNLLAIIYGNAELLEERATDDRIRVLAGPIKKASERGADLTSRLLAFSRQQPLTPQSIDIGELCLGMIELLHRALGETIEVDLQVSKPSCAIVDPAQLENALLNLALNARDAMSIGGKLTISVEQYTLTGSDHEGQPGGRPGDYTVLSVSDTGTGVPPEIIERVFEPFFTTKEVSTLR